MRPIAYAIFGLAMTACATAPSDMTDATNLAPASAIMSEAQASVDQADWGTFYSYFAEDTHALSPVLVGVAKIDAGQQTHPPHRHADEEYLMVTRGRGIWTLNGISTPANPGDILFARAWDYHGIRAANEGPMEFVVFKYSGRAVDRPANPHPEWAKERPVRPR
ncbi:cupin domain-containing protein [Algimonas arctica]|nr:cupin domain-containing protein [Algimonas arctica]